MHLFPWIHPQSRKTQLTKYSLFDNKMDIDKYPYFDNQLNTKSEYAILKEGEILYIPPFWMHEVFAIPSSVAMSINLNIWSTSEFEYNFQERLLKYAMPFDLPPTKLFQNPKLSKRAILAIVLRQYFRIIIQTFCLQWKERMGNIEQIFYDFCVEYDSEGNMSMNIIIQRLVNSRYEPIFMSFKEKGNEKLFKNLETLQQSFLNMRDICQWTEMLWYENTAENLDFLHWFSMQISDEKFEKYAQHFVSTELIVDDLNFATSLIYVSAYFEIVSEYFLGVKNVYPFFKYCFQNASS